MFPIRDTIIYHGSTAATKSMIGLNFFAFIYHLAIGAFLTPEFFFRFGFVPVLFFENPLEQLYTIFTSMFIHGSFMHLFGNAWFLWVFGPAVEGRLGFRRFIMLYLLSGLAASLLQGFAMSESITPVIGASGAVSGILGAYLILFPRARVLTIIPPFIFFPFWLPSTIYLGYWAFLQFIYALGDLPGIAWWAHLGGFLMGLILILLIRPRRNYRADPFWECWRDYC